MRRADGRADVADQCVVLGRGEGGGTVLEAEIFLRNARALTEVLDSRPHEPVAFTHRRQVDELWRSATTTSQVDDPPSELRHANDVFRLAVVPSAAMHPPSAGIGEKS